MDASLLDLFHKHIGSAFDRQLRLGAFMQQHVDDESWNYTISTATLEFGTTLKFTAPYLGSHADPDNSWLWAWCNPQLQLNPANKKLATAVRKLGKTTGVAAFSAKKPLSCAEALGEAVSAETAHVFAAIVSRELGYDAYYTIPFEYGRAAALIRDDRLAVPESNPTDRMVTVFPQVVSAITVPDHRAAFTAYALDYGLELKESPRLVRVLVNGKETLKAKFDKHNRLTDLSGKLTAG